MPKNSQPLLLPAKEYDSQQETLFRSQVENIVINIDSDVTEIENIRTKTSTLALRRHQFLLMGASSV
jgi:hypothetical protein